MLYIIRRVIQLLLICAALVPTGATASNAVLAYSDTCRFFSNAAFQDRHVLGEVTFRMELAQDCIDALVYLQSTDPEERDRADDYLSQLEAYRQVIVGIIVARAQARPPEAEDHPGYQLWRPAVHPVSRSGAYLIAREMGVVNTHQVWTNWRRAAALPLFRLDEVQAN